MREWVTRGMGGAGGIELGGHTIYRLAYVDDVDIIGETSDEVMGKASEFMMAARMTGIRTN